MDYLVLGIVLSMENIVGEEFTILRRNDPKDLLHIIMELVGVSTSPLFKDIIH
jgi:hypothetical protein